MSDKQQMMRECWDCTNRYPIPGNAHIGCRKPDPDMTGHKHGIKNGWFIYPFCFDPTWKTKLCANFEAIENTTSQSCSQSTK